MLQDPKSCGVIYDLVIVEHLDQNVRGLYLAIDYESVHLGICAVTCV